MKVKLFILALVLLSARNINAGGDSVVTDEIIVISNKVSISKLYSPNKIQVIDKDYINSVNGLRLSDVLKFADGVFIKDYGFSSGLKTISQNSSQSEHTLIYIDGVKLNSPQNGTFDLGLLSNDGLEYIEISSGGSSALYGSQSVAGTINIFTEGNFSNHSQVLSLSALIGSFGMKKYRGSLSFKPSLNSNLRFSFSQEWSQNDYRYYIRRFFEKITRRRENSDYLNRNLQASFSLKPGNEITAGINAIFFSSEKGVPGPELGYQASSARQVDEGFISVLAFSFKRSGIGFNYQHSFNYSLMKYFDPSSFGLPVELNSFYKNIVHESSADLKYRFNSLNELSSGITAGYSKVKSDRNVYGEMKTLSFSSTFRHRLNNFNIYPSVRYDYYSHISSGNVFTFRLGVNYKPFRNQNLSFKSTVGNNFRAPTFNDLYWKELGNRNLRPERSVSFDAGIYYKSKLLDTEAELNYFLIRTTDRILWRPVSGSIWRPVNIGEVKTEGIVINFNSKVLLSKDFNTSVKSSFSYSKAVKTNEDFPGDPAYLKQLIYVPAGSLKASLVVNYLPVSNLFKLLSFSAFFCYYSRRYSDAENRNFVPAYRVIDANITVEISITEHIRMMVKGSADNLFNEEYEIIAGYPQPLRGYKLEIGFKY